MAVSAAQAIADYNANHGTAAAVVVDTAANLLAAVAGLQTVQAAGKLTQVLLSGTANVATLAQVQQLSALRGFAVQVGGTLLISDSAAALVSPGSGLALAKATGIQVTGTNLVTARAATTLAGLRNFALAAGATLVIADSAVNLLSGLYGAGIALARAIHLTNANNIVTVVQALQLLALPGFGLATGAGLIVVDSAANLLASNSAAALAAASSVRLSGTGNVVTAAQAGQLFAGTAFRLSAGAILVITDSAADLLTLAPANANKATSVVLTGSNAVSAAQAKALSAIRNFAIGAGATLAVNDGASNLLLLSNTAGLARATSVHLTGANTIRASQAERLSLLPGFALAAGATLAIADNATAILDSANAGGLALATSVELIGAGATLTGAQADTLVASPHFSILPTTILMVSDTAATLLSGADAPGLAYARSTRLVGDNTTTVAQALALAPLPGFHLGTLVTGTLTIADSASAVLGQIDALQAMAGQGQITAITLNDGGTPVLMLTGAQYDNDAAALALITSPFVSDVVGKPGETLTARSADVVLDGSAGSQVLNAAGAGGDTLVGGNGDTLNGGAGNDIFAFAAGFGAESVTGFVASGGNGAGPDILQFASATFADWAHVLGASAQVGSDVVITLDAQDTITLKGVILASLSSANARFV